MVENKKSNATTFNSKTPVLLIEMYWMFHWKRTSLAVKKKVFLPLRHFRKVPFLMEHSQLHICIIKASIEGKT